MRTKPLYSNCHFGLAYLLLRGAAKEVVFAPGGNWLIPWHVGIVTRNRHYISFYRLLPHEQNRFGAWWFLGSFNGIRRSQWMTELLKRGRIRRMEPTPILAAYVVGYCVLFWPWCLAWFLYGPRWSFGWAIKALKCRLRRNKQCAIQR